MPAITALRPPSTPAGAAAPRPLRAPSGVRPKAWRAAAGLLPGLLLCLAVSGAAAGLEAVETRLFGRAWLETLVLAILVGTAVRTAWTPGRRWLPGVEFGAKLPLEVAVVLLGVSVDTGALLAAGPGLPLGIAGVVALAIAAGYGLGRLLGLRRRMAVLVACGNAICGNSAIAAVASAIGADGEDVAASIAFTAVLGVLVVLGLPLLVPVLHLSAMQYGALAGLTVYAVPQVLAATAPVGPLAVQVGTAVKLVRVLMLAPVVLALSLLARRARAGSGEAAPHADTHGRPATRRVRLHALVPWFILGFLALAGLRAAGLVPQAALAPAATTANWLTVVSMAALGLGTDLRAVARAGGRVTAAVIGSLLVLGAISLGLIRLLGVA